MIHLLAGEQKATEVPRALSGPTAADPRRRYAPGAGGPLPGPPGASQLRGAMHGLRCFAVLGSSFFVLFCSFLQVVWGGCFLILFILQVGGAAKKSHSFCGFCSCSGWAARNGVSLLHAHAVWVEVWSEWGSWEACGPGGGGKVSRYRQSVPREGGIPCSGDNREVGHFFGGPPKHGCWETFLYVCLLWVSGTSPLNC